MGNTFKFASSLLFPTQHVKIVVIAPTKLFHSSCTCKEETITLTGVLQASPVLMTSFVSFCVVHDRFTSCYFFHSIFPPFFQPQSSSPSLSHPEKEDNLKPQTVFKTRKKIVFCFLNTKRKRERSVKSFVHNTCNIGRETFGFWGRFFLFVFYFQDDDNTNARPGQMN